MEAGGHSRNSGKPGKKPDRSRRIWSLREEEALVVALRDIVLKGWKCENGFKTGYLGVLEQYMMKSFPGTDLRAEPHINSKIHVWKKTHGTLSSMLAKSGFEWNNSTHMITVEDEDVWDQYVKVDANARSTRYKSFPFYYAWCEIFGKDRATGEHAEDCTAAATDVLDTENDKDHEQVPNDGINGVNYVFEDDNIGMSVSQPEESESSKKSNSKKRKSKDPINEKFVEIMGKYCNDTNQRLGEIAKRIGYEFDASKKRTDVYEALGRLPGLNMSQKTYVAKLLVNNSKDLDLFFSLPDEERVKMVRMMLTGQF